MTVPVQPIPVAKPVLDENEVEAVRRVILSGWVTQGPEVAAFERDFAAYVGAPHACAVSNCTTALHLALLALGVGAGDEVITVSHSFIATANAVKYCGATPVFVDIEPTGFNIDPALLEKAIGPRTKAILCVHQLGMPCDVGRITEVAGRFGLPVIEDAACAIGSEILWKGRWERIGKPHADIACFSFHPRKVITTGDGGMLTTANPEYDRKFRLWRQHSMSVSDTVRHGARQVIFESYPEVGFNYRMTDLQAAVGREQLKRLPDIVERRRALADRYRTLLTGVEMVSSPTEPPWARSNWQSYAITLAPDVNQLAVMQALLDLGVAARRGVMCSHREAPYPSTATLSRSEHAQDSSVILPLFTQLTDDDLTFVVDALKRSVAAAKAAHV